MLLLRRHCPHLLLVITFVIVCDKKHRASELWCMHTQEEHVILNAATFAGAETKQSNTTNNGKLCPLWGTITKETQARPRQQYTLT
jgi:hypothetical protein